MEALKVLELETTSTLEDAKKNFRRLSFKYHPDKVGGSSEKFQKLVDAYTFIKNHPDLLNNPPIEKTTSYLCVKISVSLEDIYFESIKKIKINQKAFCMECEGTGSSEKRRGICQNCHGLGIVENKVLRIMGKKEGIKCPSCGGLGVKPNRVCPVCKGKKVVIKEKEHAIKLNKNILKNKLIVINGEGNVLPDGSVDDLFIRVEIEQDSSYLIENAKIVKKLLITPTQNILGDRVTVCIFGKSYRIYVPPYSKYIKINDNRLNGRFKKSIDIKIIVTNHILNDTIKELYLKILEEEKKILNNEEPASVNHQTITG